MIIDCHGHYTTAPKGLQAFRDAQLAELKNPPATRTKGAVSVSDDEIRESLEGAQLKLQRERGSDVTVFSPRASAMTPWANGTWAYRFSPGFSGRLSGR